MKWKWMFRGWSLKESGFSMSKYLEESVSLVNQAISLQIKINAKLQKEIDSLKEQVAALQDWKNLKEGY